MLNQDLFCDGLLNNLVKTREVENITNATKLVVNFRSLGSVLCSVRSIIDFSRNLQEVSLNSTDQRYLADLWINELQKFSKQKTKVIPLTRGLKTTRSIPRRPKSEIFAGIPFTWGTRVSKTASHYCNPSPWTRRPGCWQRQCPCPWSSPSCWCSGCASWFPWSLVGPGQEIFNGPSSFRKRVFLFIFIKCKLPVRGTRGLWWTWTG